MRAFRSLIILAAVVSLLPSIARAADPPPIKDRLRAALREATEHVDEIERVDVRAGSLQSIGTAQVKLGDRDQARATLHRALKLITDDQAKPTPSSWDYFRISLPRMIAADLAKIGDQSASRAGFRQAIEAAERIDTKDVRNQGFIARHRFLVGIALAQFEAGYHDLARETFERAIALDETLGDIRETSDLLCQVAKIRWTSGDHPGAAETFDRAIRHAETLPAEAHPEVLAPIPVPADEPPNPQVPPAIPDMRGARDVLGDIAAARLKVGDADGALATLDNPKVRGTFHGATLRRLADAIRADDKDAAARVLSRLRQLTSAFKKGGHDQLDALIGMAKAQARLGDFDAALGTAHDIAEWPAPVPHLNQFEPLLAIATAQIDAGEKTAARSLLRKLSREFVLPIEPGVYPGLPNLGQIARAQARAGDLEGASWTIAAMSPTNDAGVVTPRDEPEPEYFIAEKAETLVALAIAQAAAHDPAAARESCRLALKLAESIKMSVRRRLDLIVMIADAQAQAGDFDTAIKIARTFEGDPGGRMMLLRVVTNRRKAGDIPAALRLANAITDEKIRDGFYSVIARDQAETGDAEEALRMASQLDITLRAWALRQIVDGLEKREAKSKGSK